jgi:Ca2+-binding EF-hand superfamily protein
LGYDSGGDGTISLEEFQAAHARIFKAIDADKDGTLTLGEMQQVPGFGQLT